MSFLWGTSTEASHQSGTGGPIAELREAQYPAASDIDVLGQNTVQSRISFLQSVNIYKYTFYHYRMVA